MRFMYADESGTPDQTGESRYFVFGGVALEENTWHEFENSLNSVISANLGGSIELHAGDVRSGRGSYRKIPPQQRWKCIDDVFALLADNVSRIPVFLVVVDMDNVAANQPVRELAGACLREAFKEYMRSMELVWSQRRVYDNRKARYERGLIICDQQGREKGFQDLFASLHSDVQSDQHMLVENLLFKDSRSSRLIQAADLTCHMLYRVLYGKNENYAGKLASCFTPLKDNAIPHAPISFRYISDNPPLDRPPLFRSLPVDKETNLPYGSHVRPPYISPADPRWPSWAHNRRH